MNGTLPASAETRGSTFWKWCAIGFTVLLSHLALLDESFLETWFAPLHVLWIAACAAGICWWLGARSGRARIAPALAFWAATVGVTAMTTRLDWGAGMLGEGALAGVGRLPPAGLATSALSIALVVAPLWMIERRARERRGDDESPL